MGEHVKTYKLCRNWTHIQLTYNQIIVWIICIHYLLNFEDQVLNTKLTKKLLNFKIVFKKHRKHVFECILILK